MPTVTFDEHVLEEGTALRDVPVAYRTWGRLDEDGANAVLVCHALTGDANAGDWWRGLIGPGRALDTDHYFVVCANALGSPYGTASPVTANPATGKRYGPDFPYVTPRDTVALHRRLLDRLGVNRVVTAIGGSMGGMHVLEWAFHGDFVQSLVPIAVGGRHSAWCIGWSDAQRQAIYGDPKWQGGHYDPDDPPKQGLSAARMMAMISYRSRSSFEQRFGRARMNGRRSDYAIESYLRYQGEKLVDRFDANCYVSLTLQMDAHDVARGRGEYVDVLASIAQPALVIGIETDVLYPLEEQKELVEHLPEAELGVIESPHGHDAFLLEYEQLSELLKPWLAQHAPKPAPSIAGTATTSAV